MEISAFSGSGPVALVQALTAGKAQNQAQMAMVRLANEQIRQDGAAAIRLIESTPLGSLGRNIDVQA